MLNTSNSTLGGSSISSIPSMLCSSSNTMLSMGLPLVNQHLLLLLPLLTFLLVMEVILLLSTINLIILVMVPHHLNKASRSRQPPNKKIENHELTCIFISIHYTII